MGRGNRDKRSFQKSETIGWDRKQSLRNYSLDIERKRPTRNQAPSTLPNVDVHGILFVIVAIVFVVYPLAQWALGL